MPLVRTRAVILQTFPYGDTSKILRFLTPDLGVRSAIAKGALRPRSRFGGMLEPFAEGEAQFFLKEGRDLHTLSGFELLRSRQALGRNLAAFAGASLIAELMLRFGTEESQPALFHAITAALDRTADAHEEAAWSALCGVWQVVGLLGYEPELESCVVCGRPLEPDEPARFDVDAGGIACTGCRREGRIIDPRARSSIASLVYGPPEPIAPDHWSLHRALLRAFLTAHLAPDRPLRALELFIEELQ